jgi:predicted nucleic acid-binding protein
MKYLLDVNALAALGLEDHEFHSQVSEWVVDKTTDREFATCSITEVGFVRVLAQATQYGFNVSQACNLLERLKASGKAKLSIIPDDHDVSRIPIWVKTARQTTDGHLVQLAKDKDAILATLDKGIPGSFVIPT